MFNHTKEFADACPLGAKHPSSGLSVLQFHCAACFFFVCFPQCSLEHGLHLRHISFSWRWLSGTFPPSPSLTVTPHWFHSLASPWLFFLLPTAPRWVIPRGKGSSSYLCRAPSPSALTDCPIILAQLVLPGVSLEPCSFADLSGSLMLVATLV